MKAFFTILTSVHNNLNDQMYANAVLAELQKHAVNDSELAAQLPLNQIEAARSYAAAGEWSKVSIAVKQALQHFETNDAA